MKALQSYSVMSILPLLFASSFLYAQSRNESSHIHSLINRDHPICGTFLMWQLQANEQDLDEKGKALLQQYRTATRPTMDRNIVSSDGHFRIHFDVDGVNTPDLIDIDNNGVPDYIDSVAFYMEVAWKKEIEECGYPIPPPDNIGPGMGGIDGLIDVFVIDLNKRPLPIYGEAVPEGSIGNRRVGYVTLDNDYKEYPTPSIDGLRVSSAHEFHHIVQFSGYIYDDSQRTLYEEHQPGWNTKYILI